MKQHKWSIGLILLAFSLYSCSRECGDSPPDEDMFPCVSADIYGISTKINDNTIFDNTSPIFIPAYAYATPPGLVAELGSTVQVLGDTSINGLMEASGCCELLQHIDKYPAEPVFEWENAQSNLVAAAIFKDRIRVSLDGGRIQNTGDIVWTWNSGMGTGSQSSGKTVIAYKDGKDVEGGQTLASTTPLEIGKVYFWAVWAWNENGTTINFSSRAIPFLVVPMAKFNVISFDQMNGFLIGLRDVPVNWTLLSARLLNGTDQTGTFPVQGFTLTVDCNIEEGVHELSYTTAPGGETGLILEGLGVFDTGIEIGGVLFSNFVMPCDEQLESRATFNGQSYNVLYQLDQ
jgi:hypothetical protein